MSTDPYKLVVDIVEGKRAVPAAAAAFDRDGIGGARGEQSYSEAPPLSEQALALEFAERNANSLRYIASRRIWMINRGHLWEADKTHEVFDRVRDFCSEHAVICNNKKQAQAMASKKFADAVEGLARGDRRLAATGDQWDRDIWALNTPNGVVDLRTGKIRLQQPGDYLTKMTAVGPSGSCHRFHEFLDRTTGGDEELQSYWRKFFGYVASGSVREQIFIFAHGVGANGKSVLLKTVSGILGTYHRAVPIETFTASNTDRHPTEIANLCGARLVTASETEEGRRWAESRIKQLTGDDRISARFMRGDFFEFEPQLKLCIIGNHKPSLRSVDEAIRRRLHLVPFNVVIPKEQRDHNLAERLKEEWPGILQWMIEGCVIWQREGLGAPHAVREATEAYLDCEDSVAAWLDERCERDHKAWTPSGELFASWTSWAEKAGEHAGSMKRFAQKLEMKGFTPSRTRAARGFAGLRILSDSSWGDYR